MKSNQDRYFNCLEHCHPHEQFETPKRICLATLTDDPSDNPKVSINQNWFLSCINFFFYFLDSIKNSFISLSSSLLIWHFSFIWLIKRLYISLEYISLLCKPIYLKYEYLRVFSLSNPSKFLSALALQYLSAYLFAISVWDLSGIDSFSIPWTLDDSEITIKRNPMA